MKSSLIIKSPKVNRKLSMADMQNRTSIFLKTIIGLNLDHLNLTVSNIMILDQIMILPYNLRTQSTENNARAQKTRS